VEIDETMQLKHMPVCLKFRPIKFKLFSLIISRLCVLIDLIQFVCKDDNRKYVMPNCIGVSPFVVREWENI